MLLTYSASIWATDLTDEPLPVSTRIVLEMSTSLTTLTMTVKLVGPWCLHPGGRGFVDG